MQFLHKVPTTITNSILQNNQVKILCLSNYKKKIDLLKNFSKCKKSMSEGLQFMDIIHRRYQRAAHLKDTKKAEKFIYKTKNAVRFVVVEFQDLVF